MIWNMQTLLLRFPYFLNKWPGSNFYKSEHVFYEQFNGLYEQLFRVKNALQIEKSLWIFKEQEYDHDYIIHFYCSFPLLKNVKVFKEDELIHEAKYTLAEDESYSYLSHECDYVDGVEIDESIELYEAGATDGYDSLKLSDDYDFTLKFSKNGFAITHEFINPNPDGKYRITDFFESSEDDITFLKSSANSSENYNGLLKINASTLPDLSDTIYTKSYENDEKIRVFNYSYSSTSGNIIPDDKFHIEVETYNDKHIYKGFPENDIKQGNIFDHDYSIDELFGLMFDIPRRKYRHVNSSIKYINMTPPYNYNPPSVIEDGVNTIGATEDDYHYMNRILEYARRRINTPLPILELWKLYDVDSTIINRENQLCKMFEESRHPEGWAPLPWEHKDLQCVFQDETYFMIAEVDLTRPFKGQTLEFKLSVYDAKGKDVTDEFELLPFLNYKVFRNGDAVEKIFTVKTSELDQLRNVNVFQFKAYRNLNILNEDLKTNNNSFKIRDNDIISNEINITLRNCENIDYYVSNTGDDSNDGSKFAPFKTLEKAIDTSETGDIIGLLDEKYFLNSILEINKSCTIVSCENNIAAIQPADYTVFRVHQDSNLSLINIMLQKNCCELFAKNEKFTNHNPVDNPLLIGLNRSVGCTEFLTQLVSNIIVPSEIVASENMLLTGVLNQINRKTSEVKSLSNWPVEVFLNDEKIDSIVSAQNGLWQYILNIARKGVYNLKFESQRTKKYCNSDLSFDFIVYNLLDLILEDNGEFWYETTLQSLELEINKNTSLFTAEYEVEDEVFITIEENGDIIMEEEI